jgi:hypothetical protein
MEEIYNITGRIVWWGCSAFGLGLMIYQLFKFTLNSLGKAYNWMWILADFFWHRRQFKEWLKENVHKTNRKTKFKIDGN